MLSPIDDAGGPVDEDVQQLLQINFVRLPSLWHIFLVFLWLCFIISEVKQHIAPEKHRSPIFTTGFLLRDAPETFYETHETVLPN